MNATDAVELLMRLTIGGTMMAHGWNHAFGGGRIEGTARWFASLGTRRPKLQAITATVTELAAGMALVLGMACTVACAAIIGTLVVAWITAHLANGFFIFRPGQGYEYVMVLIVGALALAVWGPGALSFDAQLHFETNGWFGWLSLPLGAAGALFVLAIYWRPNQKPA